MDSEDSSGACLCGGCKGALSRVVNGVMLSPVRAMLGKVSLVPAGSRGGQQRRGHQRCGDGGHSGWLTTSAAAVVMVRLLQVSESSSPANRGAGVGNGAVPARRAPAAFSEGDEASDDA